MYPGNPTCPDCKGPLQRLADRLHLCPISGFYYISKHGKLSAPLLNPPASVVETTEEEPQKLKQRPASKTKKIGKLKIPDKLIRELTESIGADMIPLFLRYMKEMLNVHPVKYLTHPKDIKRLLETDHFPRWLKKIGAL